MSFSFSWPTFSQDFYTKASQILAQGLNRGPMPPIIAGQIEVEDLHMGTMPPELRILSIGDITMERFRGIFQLNYTGDAHIVLKTKVQANPLNHPRPPTVDLPSVPTILFASTPLTVPMYLRLSSLRISATIVLVVSKQKGITMVFKNDPLQSVEVSSTFDNIQVMKGFIQREIEGQLRELFRGDLPELIHKLSRNWIQEEITRGTKMPPGSVTVENSSTRLNVPRPLLDKTSMSSIHSSKLAASSSIYGDRSPPISPPVSPHPYQFLDVPSPLRSQHSTVEYPSSEVSVPEAIENYDPTYGLRPDGLPTHGRFEMFKRLWKKSQIGLESVLKDGSSDEETEDGISRFDNTSVGKGGRRMGTDDDPFDIIGLKDLVVGEFDKDAVNFPKPPTQITSMLSWDGVPSESDHYTYFDTVPAVGGGVITKPRVIHRSSKGTYADDTVPWNLPFDSYHQERFQMQANSIKGAQSPRSSVVSSEYYHSSYRPPPPGFPLSSTLHPLHERRLSQIPEHMHLAAEDETTLNPQKSNACAHITTLAKSNQTLSPFTRGFERFSISSSCSSIITSSLAGLNYGNAHIVGRTSLGTNKRRGVPLDKERQPHSRSVAPAKAVRKRKHRIGSHDTIAHTSSTDFQRSLELDEMSDYFPRFSPQI